MITRIFAIHGAWSSPKIFNYLKYRLGDGYSWEFLNYQDQVHNLQGIIDDVIDLSEPHHVIGHSMGGLIGLKLLSKSWVSSLTTIATPIGGIELNMMQRYLTRSTFLLDIADYSTLIQSIKNIKTIKPIQHIISTKGFNPFLYEENDGVVTLKSQRSVKFGKSYEIAATHTEVVMHNDTASIIDNFYKVI